MVFTLFFIILFFALYFRRYYQLTLASLNASTLLALANRLRGVC